MNIVEKMIAGFIERVFGNWVTTVIGLLVGIVGLLAGVLQVIPASLVWHGFHVQTTLVAVATVAGAVALILAKDKGITVTLPKVGVMAMLFLLGGLSAAAQSSTAPADLQNVYAAGVSYSVNGSPAVAGTALYAHLLNGSGTYAFTAVDAVPASVKPFTVTSNVGVGVGQRVFTVGKVPVYMPTAAGVSWTGTHTGWQWTGGAMAAIRIKDGYYIMPSVRFLKSNVSGGSGYQPIVGVLFGWGK